MLVRERHVVEPSVVGSVPYEEARVHEQPGEQEDPVAERVQSREGHVPRPDHERHEVVAESEQHRGHEEEDHGDAMHGEELVERLGPDERLVRPGELDPEQHRLDPGGEEEDEGRVAVPLPDPLVVDGVEPGAEAGLLLPDLLQSSGEGDGHAGYFNPWRKATTASSSSERRGIGGIRFPGFTDCESPIQMARFDGVLESAPAPMEIRLPTWVRSGPTSPRASVPLIVWHPTHADE